MGAGWFVACEERGRVALPHGGRALLFAQYHLEEFAKELGLAPLKDFFSSDPVALAAYLHSQGIERGTDELPEEMWHDPADALPTLRALLARLDDDPGPIQSLDKVRADLSTMLEIIANADQTGERFHLATGMPDLSDREPTKEV